jgi:hypothetical protein
MVMVFPYFEKGVTWEHPTQLVNQGNSIFTAKVVPVIIIFVLQETGERSLVDAFGDGGPWVLRNLWGRRCSALRRPGLNAILAAFDGFTIYRGSEK